MTWTEIKVKPKTPLEDFPEVWTGRRWDGPGNASIDSDEAPAFLPVPDSDGKLSYAKPPTGERRATVTIRPRPAWAIPRTALTPAKPFLRCSTSLI